MERFESEMSWPEISNNKRIIIDIETISRIVFITDKIRYMKKTSLSLFVNTLKRVFERLKKILAFENNISRN